MISYHRDSEMHDGSRCYKCLKICIFDSVKYGRNLCLSNHSTSHGNPAFLKEYRYPIIRSPEPSQKNPGHITHNL